MKRIARLREKCNEQIKRNPPKQTPKTTKYKIK